MNLMIKLILNKLRGSTKSRSCSLFLPWNQIRRYVKIKIILFSIFYFVKQVSKTSSCWICLWNCYRITSHLVFLDWSLEAECVEFLYFLSRITEQNNLFLFQCFSIFLFSFCAIEIDSIEEKLKKMRSEKKNSINAVVSALQDTINWFCVI